MTARCPLVFWLPAALSAACSGKSADRGQELVQPTVGAYFFGGWAGRNRHADDSSQPWARNAPTHLTRRMVEEFPGREPVWGWRDDSPAIMDRQIDLAADNGLGFFAFCWYWSGKPGAIDRRGIDSNPRNKALQLFRASAKRNRLKYCLMVANHAGAEIVGPESWKQAADLWIGLFADSNYLRVDGKPLIIVFNVKGADRDGLRELQERARQAGFPGVSIAGCGGAENDSSFQYATNYNIHRGTGAPGPHPYSELRELNRARWKGSPRQPRIPVVTSGWDRRPWEGPGGMAKDVEWYYPDRTPEKFEHSLVDAFDWMRTHPSETTREKIVLVYAWNELGEGGYLVPTRESPQPVYLKAIQRALAGEAVAVPPGK